ncbi:MAG: PD-(D/E)XK nuclease family protein [Thermoanaerobaculum sp.]|nr:PD-(D/E)XK nuclease family protein [Thermoanaerobaculum sp.]
MTRSRLIRAPTPEEGLLLLGTLLQEGWRGQPWRPQLVVVPSTSVRQGVMLQLLAQQPAWVGVEVRTVHGAAMAVLEELGVAAWPREELLAVLVHRAARGVDRPWLRGLAELPRLGPLLAAVRDLLDAGFTAAHLEAAEELLGAEVQGSFADRARTLVRLAAEVEQWCAQHEVLRRSDVVRWATDGLRQGQARDLWSFVYVYGFADVTGVVGDFLEALLRALPGVSILVCPPHPVAPRVPAQWEFLARLQQRLAWLPPTTDGDGGRVPELSLCEAPDWHSEVRWVAEQILLDLQSGVPPEAIAVVARDWEGYRQILAHHFSLLGIPFSFLRPAPWLVPLGRELQRFLALARARESAPVAWAVELLQLSDANVAPLGKDLEQVARTFGVHTLGQLATRMEQAASSDEREVLATAQGEKVREWLEKLQKRFTAWPSQGNAGTLLAGLEHLALWLGVFGQRLDGLRRAMQEVEQQAGELSLWRDEVLFLVEQALRRQQASPLGGQGGGVQVLSSMEARFRCFQRLYLLGLQRDLFPRVAAEDPLLPDFVRQKLATILPDIPLAQRAADEERYLFALLLASAPRVTVSWAAQDADGKPLTRSPFADELVAAGFAVQLIPHRRRLQAGGTCRVASPAEWVTYHAEEWDPRSLRQLFQAVAEETVKDLSAAVQQAAGSVLLKPARVARARWQVLRAWDHRDKASGLSPFLGFMGSVPWLESCQSFFSITSAEAYAQCPWQAFLQRLIKIGPAPLLGPQDLEADKSALGEVVHLVLAKILSRGQKLAGKGRSFHLDKHWPEEQELEALLRELALKVLRRRGKPYLGLVSSLAAQAKPYVGVARDALRELEPVYSVDVEGALIGVDRQRGRAWCARYDVVLDPPGGLPIYGDYKTGKAERYLKGFDNPAAAVRRGELLQVAFYAVARSAKGKGVYILLDPDHEGPRTWQVQGSEELRNDVFSTLRDFEARAQQGIFFPRLVDPDTRKEPESCPRCPVRLACARGETTARLRLQRWGEGQRERVFGGVEAQALAHWWLGQRG